MRTFQRNGYRVHFVHQSEYLFTMGCDVDLCSPTPAWVDAFELLPSPVRRGFSADRSLPSLERRALAQIDEVADSDTPHFVYIHFQAPDHSLTTRQSLDELADFRQGFGDRIRTANKTLLKLTRRILSRDSGALIILNSDHGAWGFGSAMWADRSLFDAVPDRILALDHLGVQLAIHWPNGAPAFETPIRSNVNLFRYVFSHLSESPSLLQNPAPDDGFLVRGLGQDSEILQVLRDGALLERLETLPRAATDSAFE